MLDIGASELLLTIIVAIVVIGPKDLPRALRTAGQWIGKIRRISGHFRSGIENMIREAELEEMERKWREQNDAIMKAHPAAAAPAGAALIEHAPTDPVGQPAPAPASAEAGASAAHVPDPAEPAPQLPLTP